MKKKRTLKIIGLVYFISIFLFGFTYWVLWYKNPSNFIINSEYNEHTIRPFYFHGDLDTLENKNRFISAKETNELIAPYYDTLNEVRKEIDSNKFSISILRKKDSLNSVNQSSFFSNKRNAEIENSTKVSKAKLDSLIILLFDELQIQKKTEANSQTYFDNQVKIANLNYSISLIELEISKQKLKIYNKDFGDFYSDSLKNVGLVFYNQIDSLEKLNNKLLENTSELTESIRLNVVAFYLGQKDKVSFFDFIYFSIVTATSTGYGDILPNSTLVRILASSEIFMSLFLFGFFFYYIAKPKEEK